VELADDVTLIPSFTPPLRGWLKLTRFRGVDLLKDMIDLFGGLRFRRLDFFDVDGMPFLLKACVKTLETLRVYPSDPRGKPLSPEGVRISPTALKSNPPSWTLIYQRTSHFKRSRSQSCLSVVSGQLPSQTSSTTRSPQSHPPNSPRSWFYICGLISLVWKPGTHYVGYHEQWKSRDTVGCLQHSVGSIKSGTFSSTCARTFGTP